MTTRAVTLANRGGARHEVDARRPLLDTLREQGVDLPYGCRYGGCITCAAKLTSGEIDQRRQVALNNRQTVFDDDGSFRIYCCKDNPGVKNWICTEGHRRGQVVLRTLLAEADLDPEMKVIKIADIPEKDRI